ncbi:MAG: c-type cytochrome [Caulobacteraceae bacterium]
MLKSLTLPGLALLLLCSTARAEEVSPSAGQRLAAAQCGGCHAVDMAGESPNPSSPPFRDLGVRFPFDGLKDALVKGMIVGHPQMPVFHLTPTDSDNLIAYLKSLQRRSAEGPRGRLILARQPVR